MRGVHVAEHADPSLQRAMAEMGCPIDLARPAEALWAISEGAAPDVILYDLAEIGARHLAACAAAKPAACMLIVLLRDRRGRNAEFLRAGADACLGRPLSFLELDALIHAFFRRRGPAAPQSAAAARTLLKLHRRSRKATIGGDALPLSQREFDLLLLLAEASGAPVDHAAIWQRIGESAEFSSESIGQAVSRLRRRLAGTGLRLLAARGAGYRLLGEIGVE